MPAKMKPAPTSEGTATASLSPGAATKPKNDVASDEEGTKTDPSIQTEPWDVRVPVGHMYNDIIKYVILSPSLQIPTNDG
jgi:hypothetical protein